MLWQADAVVFVRPRRPHLSIWVRRANGDAVPVEVPVGHDDDDDTLALRATELLRGHLLTVGPRAPEGEPSRTPLLAGTRGERTSPRAANAHPWFRFSAGPALAVTDGRSAAFGVTASIGFSVTPRVELGAFGLVPLGGSYASVPGRSVKLREWLAGAIGRYHFELPTPWLLDAAIFAGTRAASYEAVRPASIGNAGTELGVLFGALLQGGVLLTSPVALHGGAGVFAGPPIEISVAGPGQGNAPERSARLGVGLVLTLALEARF